MSRLAGPNCSYHRFDADLAGGLNIGLAFIGIGGIGNFIIGRTGYAVGQLILELTIYFICFPMCCAMCCVFSGNEKTAMGFGGTLFCVAVCAYLAGFAWSIADGARMIQLDIIDGNGYNLYKSA